MSDNIVLKRATKAVIDATAKQSGSLLITTDEKGIFIDVNGTSRTMVAPGKDYVDKAVGDVNTAKQDKVGGAGKTGFIKSTTTAGVVTYDNSTYLTSVPIATASVTGGIKASPKTAAETVEVKIDSGTGKLFVPEGGSSLDGINYKFVNADKTPLENGANLVKVYSAVTNSAIDNVITIICSPGKYQFTSELLLTKPFVNIVCLVDGEYISLIGNFGMNITATANNVVISGIKFFGTLFNNSVFRYVKIKNCHANSGFKSSKWTAYSIFENCEVVDDGFIFKNEETEVMSGYMTFINCKCGIPLEEGSTGQAFVLTNHGGCTAINCSTDVTSGPMPADDKAFEGFDKLIGCIAGNKIFTSPISANHAKSDTVLPTDDEISAIWKLQNQIGIISTSLDNINKIII